MSPEEHRARAEALLDAADAPGDDWTAALARAQMATAHALLAEDAPVEVEVQQDAAAAFARDVGRAIGEALDHRQAPGPADRHAAAETRGAGIGQAVLAGRPSPGLPDDRCADCGHRRTQHDEAAGCMAVTCTADCCTCHCRSWVHPLGRGDPESEADRPPADRLAVDIAAGDIGAGALAQIATDALAMVARGWSAAESAGPGPDTWTRLTRDGGTMTVDMDPATAALLTRLAGGGDR